MAGSKTSKKRGTSKQAKVRAKFKRMIAEAKRIKKANPSKAWQTCIKEAAKK